MLRTKGIFLSNDTKTKLKATAEGPMIINLTTGSMPQPLIMSDREISTKG
jgi:hypothetical protein